MKSGAVISVLVLVIAACRATGTTSDYVLVFEGNRSIGERVLRRSVVDNLADFERSGYAKSAIDDAAFQVESLYRSEGFPFAAADYDLEPDKNGKLRATIRILEGPRSRLGTVAFEGNELFDAGELSALVGGPTGLLGSVTYFVQAEVDAARGAITDRYVAAGNLLARVDVPEVVFSEDRQTADVVFRIDGGPTFRVGSIEFTGGQSFTEEDLRTALPISVGQPYVPNVDRRIRAALIEFLGESGRPDARVAVSRRLDNDAWTVAVEIEIEEGPHVVVGSVRIEGNERTRESLILSRLDVEIGEALTPTRERRTFRSLFSTGLFSSIRLELDGEGEERDLVVTVAESPGREVFIEPGWGSYELGRVKAGYRNLNLFGTGRSFRAEGIAAVRHQEVEIGIGDPFLFGADVHADTSLQVLRREEPSFTRIQSGFDVTVTRQWARNFVTGVSYDLRRSKARDVDVTDPAALAALDDVDISAIEVSVRLDTRDSPLVASRGHSARAALQWGDRYLGSELDFLRARYSQSHFFPIRSSTVLALSLRTGAIIPTHDTKDIPLQERLFNGGESTVRSFRQDELGPVDLNGEPLGGEAFTVLNAEIRQRLLGNLSGAVFGDMGNVAANYEDYFEFDDFRSALGVGIRYFLPIGPLRVDAAWNPHPKGGEESFLLHFSVGMAF